MSRLKVCTLVSGSSANSSYVEVDGCGLLIDAGTGIRRTEALLNSVGSSLSDVRGIFITHEHTDHISGLKTITKKHRYLVVIDIHAVVATLVIAAQYLAIVRVYFRCKFVFGIL